MAVRSRPRQHVLVDQQPEYLRREPLADPGHRGDRRLRDCLAGLEHDAQLEAQAVEAVAALGLPEVSADQITAARQLYDAKEHTVEQIAAMFDVSRHTVYHALEQAS